MRKLLHFFLAFLFLFLSYPLAQAHNEVADITREGSIQVSLKDAQGKTISGIELSLYKVADVIVDNGYIFKYSRDFSQVQTNIDANISKPEYAKQLSDYAKANNLPAMARVTTNNSKVAFAKLKMGLYLVRQTNQVKGYANTNPFLVTIPFRNADGSLSYDVDSSPKTGVLAKVAPKLVRDKKLPLTGQLWWPVWVCVGVGFVLCVVGVVGKRNANIKV